MSKSYNTTNVFGNFAFELYDIFKSISNICKENKIYLTNTFDYTLTKRLKYDKYRLNKDELYNLNLSYSVVSQLWDTDISFSKWIHLVEQFSKFIRTAEKCFMYHNESSIDKKKYKYIIYSELVNNNEIMYIRFLEKDIKIRITFKSSMIDEINDDKNSLKEFIENGSIAKIEQYLTFINIFITREFGKQVSNEFNFIDNEEPIYNDFADEILMENIRLLVSQAIKYTYERICMNDILNSLNLIIPPYMQRITIEEFLNGEYHFQK